MTNSLSLSMFNRSINATTQSLDALGSGFTLAPFYNFDHFVGMALAFFTHIYNLLANLLLALCCLPITLYSLDAGDSCFDAVERGITSMCLHTFSAFTYAINLVLTPVIVVIRALVSICWSGEPNAMETGSYYQDEVNAALCVSFDADDPNPDLKLDSAIIRLRKII